MGIYSKKALILYWGSEKSSEKKLHLSWALRRNESFPDEQPEKTYSAEGKP